MSPVGQGLPSSLRPRGFEFTALSTTDTANSGWIDMSGLLGWTLWVLGLETGATLLVEAANGATAPAGHGTALSSLTPDTNNNAAFAEANSWHWVRLTKTQGGTPAPTVATIHALFA